MRSATLVLLLAPIFLHAQLADWDTLDQQVEQLYLKGDMAGAIRVARQALDAASTPKQSGRSLDRLGFLNYNSGNLKDGESYLRQGLELRRTKLGRDTADYAESANDLALFCRDSRRFPEAQALAEEAVAVRSKVLGANDPLVAETLETLGSIYSAQGQYENSASTFEKAKTIYETRLDAKNPAPEYGTLLINLGGNYQRLGKYRKAESSFEAGLDVLRRTIGANHPIYATSLMGPAYLETDLGNYAAAEKYFAEAVPVIKMTLGERHPIYAQVLDHRAVLYQAMGNSAAAEADYRTALELRNKIYGPNHEIVAATLRNYGRLVYSRSPAEGEALLRKAAEIYSGSSDHPPFEYASTLLALGETQRLRGDLSAARETFERALDVAAQGLGRKHPVYANALASLGVVDRDSRDYANGEQRLREAIATVTESQGDNHPDVAKYSGDLAALYEQKGDYDGAVLLYRRSFEINDRLLSVILNVGSESNKADVLRNLADPLPALIEFQRKAGEKAPEARVLAFEAVARRKGRVLDSVRDWRRSLLEDSTGNVRKRVAEWQGMLECEASITTALGYRDLKPAVTGGCTLEGTPLEGRYGRMLSDLRTKWTDALGHQALVALREIKEHTDALEAVLSRDLPEFGYGVKPARLEQICSRLAPEELLVEIVAYNKRYGAFVLDRAGNLQWVDLGEAQPIDVAVRDLIAAANDWSVSLSRREAQSATAAQATAEDALNQLTRSMAPLWARQEQVTPVRRLRIAPDGMLTLLPFGALSDASGHFLLERFAISYISAGRDLIAPENTERTGGPPVIALSPGMSAKNRMALSQTASIFRPEQFVNLESAEAEARAVQRLVPKAQLLGVGQATEERLKQLRRPALLHVVGHGIVRGTEDCVADPRSPGCALAGFNPGARVMSLSVIILEEAYGRGGASSQDGLLSAVELEALDFHGSEMLVLSQCRMADGIPYSGDGVYGMRRAAAIAGVKTFVAPLWNVSDVAQRRLVMRFYTELSRGRSRTEALRLAQLQLLHAPQSKSFLYWAPVILSGDPWPLPKQLFEQ